MKQLKKQLVSIICVLLFSQLAFSQNKSVDLVEWNSANNEFMPREMIFFPMDKQLSKMAVLRIAGMAVQQGYRESFYNTDIQYFKNLLSAEAYKDGIFYKNASDTLNEGDVPSCKINYLSKKMNKGLAFVVMQYKQANANATDQSLVEALVKHLEKLYSGSYVSRISALLWMKEQRLNQRNRQ
jgi:hypothetical protein